MLNCKEEVYQLTLDLMSVPSVVNTNGETDIASHIYNNLSEMNYFKQNPEFLSFQRTLHDARERYNVFALVRGTKVTSSRTVVLMGHIDTVDCNDYGPLKPIASHPNLLMEEMKKQSLPLHVEEHLLSDEWLFGRGALDMKSGVAANLYLIKHYAERPEELEGNLLFVAECDEEDSSHGIRSASSFLLDWKRNFGLEYSCAVNTDLVLPRDDNDPHRYIYKGTVGKLLPTFFVSGIETHAGDSINSFDANLISSELIKEIDYNPDLIDFGAGEPTLPPVSLRMTDLKSDYTIQVPHQAFLYFNMFTHSWSPKVVLEKFRSCAITAFDKAIHEYKVRRKAFTEKTGTSLKDIEWSTRVYTFDELHKRLVSEHGTSYISSIEKIKNELSDHTNVDTRMFALEVVKEMATWVDRSSPFVILFFSSLYYSRVQMTGRNEKEKEVEDALDEAMKVVQPSYKNPIIVKDFYPYISDMSFVALSDCEDELEFESNNNPCWGSKLTVDYASIRELQLPVINIGPYGYDPHLKYERVEIHYAMEIVPNLINEMIKKLLTGKS